MVRVGKIWKKVIEVLAEEPKLTPYAVARKVRCADSRAWNILRELSDVGMVIAVERKERDLELPRGELAKLRRRRETVKYALSFKGLITYLASYKFEPPIGISKQKEDGKIETVSELIERVEREFKEYKDKYLKIREIIRRYGELFEYPLFAECKTLERITKGSLYWYFIKVATFMVSRPPLLTYSEMAKDEAKRRNWLKSMIRVLKPLEGRFKLERIEGTEVVEEVDVIKEYEKELHYTEMTIQTLKEVEDKVWRENFALGFFEFAFPFFEGGEIVPNPELYCFSQTLLEKKKSEFESVIQMLNVVSNKFGPLTRS